ncbi:TonB-dependent receptor domain-containing protein [Ferrimonas lipolytica]|uniref:TonB-dependent receptor n=1 Tax=Ferrimonas lipolytica TaxID=2724191 RepID=A0A6H1UFC1_9GAMM|nr:TonB-dependent receptor [Ferrimonas lipolytica]QIZ76492.1 TonB-dependent receptor [Ferrimonas lipolytica]
MSLKTRFAAVAITTAASSAAFAADIETITVTGSRFDTAAEYQLAVVNTVERAEIEILQPKSVVDLLERLPGLSVTRSGGSAQTASVSVRGANSDHVLVLIDGIRVSSATLGSTDFSAVSPEQIERIEVVKGPRASVWGSDAIGGVIQIFTRQLQSGQYFTAAELGSDNYGRLAAGAGVSHGEGQTSVTVAAEASDGFDVYRDTDEADDDGYDRITVGLNGEQPLNQSWSIAWQGQYNSGNSEYDDIFAATGPDQSDFDNFFWNIASRYQRQQFESQFSVGQSRDRNDQFRDGVAAKSRFQTDRDQLNFTNQYHFNDTVTAIGGVDYNNESVNGDYATSDRDLIGVYGLARARFGGWLLEAAVRFDDVEDVDSETSYNLSSAYHLSSHWRISASYGTGFKAPTFNDLFWPELGNPDLLSETSKNTEITLNYSRIGASAYLSVFKNEIENLIDWAGSGEFDQFGWEIYRPSNVADAQMRGVEFGSQFQFWGLTHELAYTYLDTEDKSSGEQLVSRSEHEADYAVSYQWQQLDGRLDYHYQGKRFAGDSNYDGSGDFLSAYHKVDLSFGYQLTDELIVRAKLNNVFDQETTSVEGYHAPGREWYLSLSYYVM